MTQEERGEGEKGGPPSFAWEIRRKGGGKNGYDS
jgi:hypothetical protein